VPPLRKIFSAVASKSSTSIEQTYAFVPLRGGGDGAGRLNIAALMPSVSIRQYSIGRFVSCVHFQPKMDE
jgi:hypothetical protein